MHRGRACKVNNEPTEPTTEKPDPNRTGNPAPKTKPHGEPRGTREAQNRKPNKHKTNYGSPAQLGSTAKAVRGINGTHGSHQLVQQPERKTKCRAAALDSTPQRLATLRGTPIRMRARCMHIYHGHTRLKVSRLHLSNA